MYSASLADIELVRRDLGTIISGSGVGGGKGGAGAGDKANALAGPDTSLTGSWLAFCRFIVCFFRALSVRFMVATCMPDCEHARKTHAIAYR